MSHLKYYNYNGWGDFASFINSQATRVNNQIICAGQGMLRRIFPKLLSIQH